MSDTKPDLSAESVVMRQVLDDAEASLRLSNFNRLAKVIFVWSQRKDHLLAGEETWADQRIGTPTFGADS